MLVPTKIYYDSKDGFLWGEDAQGNIETVKTDACVLMPENVRVDQDGHIIVRDLHGEDQMLRDLNDQIVSIKGPDGRDGRDGKDGRDVVCDYGENDTIKFHKIVNQLQPGTYTIYGNVITPKEPDSIFSSACLIVGPTHLPQVKKLDGEILKFGQLFQLKTPQDISIAFVHPDHAEDIYDGQCTEWPVKASSPFSMSVENVYLCTHGDTPYIDTTGNWSISGNDTGVAAQGPKGEPGSQFVATNYSDREFEDGYPADDMKVGDYSISKENTLWVYKGNRSFAEAGVLKGDQGPAGPNGATFIPQVNSEGVISWTNDKELQNPSPVNIKGPQGEQGEKGKDGVDGAPGQDGKDGADGTPGTKFIVPNNTFTDGRINLMQLDGVQPGDYTISVDSQTLWVWSDDKPGFTQLFTLKGDAGKDGVDGQNGKDGENGLTPFIGENGNWWIGTEDTGVQAEGKDGEKQFTDEEVAALNTLPETLNSAQSRIDALETRLAALEQILSNIDLDSLTAAYPKPKPEPSFNFINSCVVKDEASYQSLPESYRSQHGEWGTPGLQESLPWLAVEFSPIPAKQLQIKVTGPNNFEKEISYPDVEKDVTLLTLNEEELQTELITGPWTININGAQTTLIVDRDVE